MYCTMVMDAYLQPSPPLHTDRPPLLGRLHSDTACQHHCVSIQMVSYKWHHTRERSRHEEADLVLFVGRNSECRHRDKFPCRVGDNRNFLLLRDKQTVSQPPDACLT